MLLRVVKRNGGRGEHSTLSFCWEPAEAEDVVYFAYCYPYTYTELCRDLGECCNVERRVGHFPKLMVVQLGNRPSVLSTSQQHRSPHQRD